MSDTCSRRAEREDGGRERPGASCRRRFLSGVDRNVVVAGFVSLFTDVSSEMIVPVLPLFLSNTLGAGPASIGIVEGVAEATAGILKFFSGWISDRTGRRKPLMVLGYGMSDLVKPLFSAARTWGQVLAIRFADRFGKGLRGAPRDALIADCADPRDRGRAYGFHRAMDTLGAAVGPLAAFALLAAYRGDYRAVFAWSAAPGLVAVVLLLVCLREGPGRPAGAQPAGTEVPGGSRKRGAGRRFALFAAATTVFALGNSSDAFLILRAQALGLEPSLVPLAYFTFNAAYALAAMPTGILSDRVGRRPVLIGGYLVFSAIYMGFAVAGRSWHAWPLFAVYGLYYAATEGVQKAYIADIVPPESRGAAIGLVNALTGIATLPASVTAGFLWEYVNPRAPFVAGAALSAAAASMMLLLRL